MICTHCARKAPTADVCSVCGKKQRNYQPDLDEIRLGREEIQNCWTDEERESRACGPRSKGFFYQRERLTTPVVRVADLLGAAEAFRHFD